jgi:DNA-binding transcriptional regulator YbjK
MVNQPKRRARSPQDKRLRKEAMFEAARELAIEHGVREVTLAAVTARVGLHQQPCGATSTHARSSSSNSPSKGGPTGGIVW